MLKTPRIQGNQSKEGLAGPHCTTFPVPVTVSLFRNYLRYFPEPDYHITIAAGSRQQSHRIIVEVVPDLATQNGRGAKVRRYICCLAALKNNGI